MRWLSTTVFVGLVLCISSALASPEYRTEAQEEWYRVYAENYLPADLDYRTERLSGQCWQESRFNPLAYNTTSGATGECQFMAGTWGDYLKAHRIKNVSRTNQRHSIKAAAWYDRRLGFIWSSERPELERWYLVLASYNAGPGHIINAQKLAGGAAYWRDISPHLINVTGHHSAETIGYVININRWTEQLINGNFEENR